MMNLDKLDLNLLRVFEAVHVHGNASTAAAALGTLREGLEPAQAFDARHARRSFTIVMSDIGEIVFRRSLPAHLGF